MALCLGASIVSLAQNNNPEKLDTVVLDTKTPIARKNSGKTVITIDKETLENSPGQSVAEVLNTVSGIEINGARSYDGQNLNYYVRGGRNRQVVIMVDGVQLNDPSHIANDYDLRLVSASSVEKIEILKGASSVLYGSGAATAVINITTKKASKEPIAATISSTLGTNRPTESDKNTKLQAFTSHATVNGTLNNFFYNANFSNRYTDGLSALAAPKGEALFESDVFNRYDGRINLGYHISEDITVSQFFSFDKFKAGFDNFDFTDAEFRSISEQLKTGGHFEWNYKNGTYIFNDTYTWIEREIASGFPSKYDSDSYTFDTYINHRFTNQLQVVVGLNGNFSSFNSFSIPFGETDFNQDVDEDTAKFNIIDPYVNAVYISDFGLTVNAGARLNIHSVYDTHLVYNVNPSYAFGLGNNTLKVLGSYSTAYITPSLFQLYDPLYGNEELIPEENTTIEGGLEFASEEGFRVSALYFNREEKNYVDFVTIDPDLFISQYLNIDETFNTSGIEVEVYKKFGKKVTVQANYTNTQADERFALRIPEHKANASIGYKVTERVFLGLDYQYVSEREDTFFSQDTFMNEDVTLESYGLLNFKINGQVTKNLKLFAGVSNILDEEYEELYQYQTRGRNIHTGFTLNL
ncbi:TonB-dependent receptor plug domain-containing protein [Marixanthomonas spongiae]|uniref:TonB-dependent receptor plug domain-containing protein n=1 Tax=Marixanthomonas spongiae TaxID=2174845 RepID=UPI00197DE13C|nr:TonB-dependent receptor plug domain-containing protein [Marixanthomonas spongiae]